MAKYHDLENEIIFSGFEDLEPTKYSVLCDACKRWYDGDVVGGRRQTVVSLIENGWEVYDSMVKCPECV